MAIKRDVARFLSVAEDAVITVGVSGDVVTLVGRLVARINGTANVIVAIRRCARSTAESDVAPLAAVAEQTV